MPTQEQIEEVAARALEIFEDWRLSGRALSRNELCARLGCKDRTLRHAVRQLRCDGYLIVADPGGGYRFARAGEEVYGFTARLKSRIHALRRVTEAMEAAAQTEFGPAVKQVSFLN